MYVADTGLLVERTGEADVWIAAADVLETGRATWTIDRVVEEAGLHLIRWRLGDRELDTYLRLDAPMAFDAALRPASGALSDRPLSEDRSDASKGVEA